MKFEAHYNLAVLLRQLNRHRDSISELHKAAILILEEPDSSTLESTYIFNLLNDATRKFITSDEYYTQKLSDEPLGNVGYTLKPVQVLSISMKKRRKFINGKSSLFIENF